MVSAHDVADEIRRLKPDVGAKQLQKFLYYVQGWHLAFTGQPVFEEAVEAWDMGPVVGAHWADEKHDRPRPAAQALDGSARETVAFVIERYGRLSARELEDLTHAEDPWKNAYGGLVQTVFRRRNPVISPAAMADWFGATEEAQVLRAEAERLRDPRRLAFGPIDRTPDLEAAVERATRGETVRQTRTA